MYPRRCVQAITAGACRAPSAVAHGSGSTVDEVGQAARRHQDPTLAAAHEPLVERPTPMRVGPLDRPVRYGPRVLDVRFAASGDVDIAYTVVGDGDVPLVWAMGANTHLETNWSFPPFRRYCEMLAEFTRLIVFDKGGMGMSGRTVGQIPFESRMDDIRAVLEAEGIERAALMGESEGGPMSILFAAAHPERVSHLVLQGAEVRERRDDDWPWGEATDDEFEESLALLEKIWGRSSTAAALVFGDDVGDDPTWINEWFARLARNSGTPREWAGFARTAFEIDVRPIVPSVRVPTLVLHSTDDRVCNVENGRFLARTVPGARYVERPGAAHCPWLDPTTVISDIREFLSGEREPVDPERVLATVLFTDVVGSTERATAMGDAPWRALLETHHLAVRAALTRHRGVEVASAGDGFLARFDGPARAIRCAKAIIDEAAAVGLDVRAGVHTGEVEIMGDDIAGIGVHIGARIGALAEGGEILVSGAVRDIVAGSGLSFRDRGERTLKGVDGRWRVFAVDPVTSRL
jgi:class 3 adenylate cyclase